MIRSILRYRRPLIAGFDLLLIGLANYLAFWLLGMAGYPRSITIIDALVLTFLAGAARLSRQFVAQLLPAKGQQRVLIIGAGDAGETIVRDMKRRNIHEPLGFVDDDLGKVGQRIHGI